MRRALRNAALILSLALLAGGTNVVAALTLGSRGADVRAVQGYLTALGLLGGNPDGVYGRATQDAVKTFQLREGLTADGVVGNVTLTRLRASAEGAHTITYVVQRGDTIYGIARRYGLPLAKLVALNELSRPERLVPGQKLTIPARSAALTDLPARRADDRGAELLPWSEVNQLFPNGATARVTDVRTGLSFQVRRIQGTYHADSEPLTLADTAAIKAAYGGVWRWDRHPVVIELQGRRVAASMNGYPHGRGDPKVNGFPGHFCLHFLGSRTHGTRVVDPDHQAAILVAARAVDRRRPGGDGADLPAEADSGGAGARPED